MTANSDPAVNERFTALFERFFRERHHGPNTYHDVVEFAGMKQDFEVVERTLQEKSLLPETLQEAEKLLRESGRDRRAIIAVLKHPNTTQETFMQHLPYADKRTLVAGLESSQCPEDWLLEASVHVPQRHLNKVLNHRNATDAVRMFVETLH